MRPLRLIASTEAAALETSARLTCQGCVLDREIIRRRDGYLLLIAHGQGCRKRR